MIRFGFVRLGRVDYQVDDEDMPTWARPWPPNPALYPKPAGPNGNVSSGFVWSSLITAIQRGIV